MSRDLKLITLALFLWGSGEGLFFYIEPLYMEQLGATPQQVGAVLGLAAFLAACSFIPGGLLADRFDAKKVMIWGWAIGAVASLGMGLASTWQVFVPWILLYNVSAYCIPVINTYIAEASGDMPLEHTITVTFAGYAAGSIVSPFIGGRLSEAFGTAPLFSIGGDHLQPVFFGGAPRQQPCAASELRQTARSLAAPPIHAAAPADDDVCAVVLCFLHRHHRHGAARQLPGDIELEHWRCQFAWRNRQRDWRPGPFVGFGACGYRPPSSRPVIEPGVDLHLDDLVSLSTPALRVLPVAAYFLLGAVPALRELCNAQLAGQVDDDMRGTVLGMNETIFSLARSLAAVLAGALFALNPRGPFIAALALIPIGMVLIARLRPVPAREEFVAMASTSNVILETVDDD